MNNSIDTSEKLTLYAYVRSPDLSEYYLEEMLSLQKKERLLGLQDIGTKLVFNIVATQGLIPCVLSHVYVYNFSNKQGIWNVTGFLSPRGTPEKKCFVLILYYPERKSGGIYTTKSQLKQAHFPFVLKEQTSDQ